MSEIFLVNLHLLMLEILDFLSEYYPPPQAVVSYSISNTQSNWLELEMVMMS